MGKITTAQVDGIQKNLCLKKEIITFKLKSLFNSHFKHTGRRTHSSCEKTHFLGKCSMHQITSKSLSLTNVSFKYADH